MSYGAVSIDNWQRVLSYVDRILKGQKAGGGSAMSTIQKAASAAPYFSMIYEFAIHGQAGTLPAVPGRPD